MRGKTEWRRRLGVVVAASVVAVGVPLATTTLTATAASCTIPSGLIADDALRGDVNATTGLWDERLRWNAIAGAASYSVQISPNEDFTNNLVASFNTVANRLDVPRQLKPITYFWRVQVSGSSCWSDDNSPAAQFSTRRFPATTLISPADNSVLSPSDLTLRWTPVQEASFYQVLVTDADNGETIASCFTPHTTWTPADVVSQAGTTPLGTCTPLSKLGFGLKYHWAVTAYDGDVAVPVNTVYSGYYFNGYPTNQPQSGQTSPVQISHVYSGNSSAPDTAAEPAGSYTGNSDIWIKGSGFSSGSCTTTPTGGGTPATVYNTTVTIGGTATQGTLTITSSGGVQTIHGATGQSQTSGDQSVVVTTHSYSSDGTCTELSHVASVATPRAVWRYTGGNVQPVLAPTPVSASDGRVSQTWTFQLGQPNDLGGVSAGSLAQATGLTAMSNGLNGLASTSCATTCSDTPTFSWTAVPNADSYRVLIAEGALVNGGPTIIVGEYETTANTVTPAVAMLDNQAGQAYYWSVQACTENGCQVPQSGAQANFVKRSVPVTITGPLNGSFAANYNVVLTWNDWQATAGVALAAEGYHVQVATDCTFSNVIDDQTTDFPEYVNTQTTYPDGTYFWRVQAVDQNQNPLTWSTPNRDVSCAGVPSFTLQKSIIGAGQPGSTGASTIVVPPNTAPAVTRLTTLDTSAKTVVKAGAWVSRKAVKAHGGTTLVTDGKKRQHLSLGFLGTKVTVSWCTGPANGWFTVYVDNKAVKSVNGYRSFTTCAGTTYTAQKLKAGAVHSITVTAQSRKGSSKRGAGMQVSVDYLTYQ